MVLKYSCPHCREVNRLPFTANDRADIARNYQHRLKDITCDNCNKTNTVRINSIRAGENKKTNAILLIIGLFASIALAAMVVKLYWSWEISDQIHVTPIIGAALLLPQLIIVTIIYNNRKDAQIFNKYFV